MPDEEMLRGGVNEVVRVGDTVRRPTGPWTPYVHGLLRHLRRRGFDGAPEVHGLTDDGREVLGFLPGEVSNYPMTPAAASETALRSAATLLRRYHDATEGYDREPAGLTMPARSPAEVICHGDYAPHNCVLDGEQVVGVFDFDTVHPGPRLRDVAYAVYRWAPLAAHSGVDGVGTLAEQARRAHVFCDHYGLDDEGRGRLTEAVIERLVELVDHMTAQAAAGHPAFARHLADGHHRIYLGDVEYVRRHRAVIDAGLRR